MISEPMEVKIRQDKRLFVIRVTGAINMVYSPQLRELIHRAFLEDVKGVVIDLRKVNYMDSSGLATLVEGVQIAEREKKRFVLTGVVSEMVQHLLEISHLDGLFEQYETVKEAEKSI